MPKLFVFAAGGTGAWVTRSLTMLLASGLPSFRDYEVYPVLIDCDVANGDLRRTIGLLDCYTQIHDEVYSQHVEVTSDQPKLFETPIKELDGAKHFMWNFCLRENQERFNEYIGLYNLDDGKASTRDLLRSLYDDAPQGYGELYESLIIGLKGHPNVGCFLTKDIVQHASFHHFVRLFSRDAGDKIIVLGSTFGGVGVNVISTLVREIVNMVPTADLAVMLMLPYYHTTYGIPDFNLRSKEVLQYYAQSGILRLAKKVYYIGCPDRYQNSCCNIEGGEAQLNEANVTELIGALAIEHFVSGRNSQGHDYKFALPDAPDDPERLLIDIDDFDSESKAVLDNLTRLAVALKFVQDEPWGNSISLPFFYKTLVENRTGWSHLRVDNTQQFNKLFRLFKNFYDNFRQWTDELGNPTSACRLVLFDVQKDYMEMSLRKYPREVRRPFLSAFLSNKNRVWLDLRWLVSRMNDNLIDKCDQKHLPPQWLFMVALDATALDALDVMHRRDRTERSGHGHAGCARLGIDESYCMEVHLDTGKPQRIVYNYRSFIPSPFARMYDFSLALAKPVDVIANDPNTMSIVNQWLDMLELVYLYAESEYFHVVCYDLHRELPLLRESKDPKHNRIADVLEAYLRELSPTPDGPSHIWLFMWDDGRRNDLVLGGTSPMSLVYTSPNLRVPLEGMGMDFLTPDGYKLFDFDRLTPLHQRSLSFREYVYNLYKDHERQLPETVAHYIRDWGHQYDWDLFAGIMNSYNSWRQTEVVRQGRPVAVNGVSLRYYCPTIDEYNTGYLLSPTRHVEGKVPLALVPGGVSGLKYLGGKWHPRYDDMLMFADADIAKRVLPGTSVKYPYLTVCDLLEDKIIMFDFGPFNSKRFYTCSKDDSMFVLPVKRRFFDYFKPEDLDEMLDIRPEFDDEKNGVTVNVTLRLPLVNGGKITLEKVYHADYIGDPHGDVVSYESGLESFNLALFPFYRLEPDLDKNVYGVMTSTSGFDSRLSFCKLSESGSTLCPRVKQSEWRDRSRYTHNLNTYYHVDGAFDFIEMECVGYTGILVPRFEIVRSQGNVKDFVFGVDFGPCFTHIAYGEVWSGALDKSSVKPLEIGGSEAQSAILLKGNVHADYNLIHYFVPNVEHLSFPMITQTGCLHDDQWDPHLPKISDLFSKANLLLSEKVETGPMSFCYTSAPYITELLWLIKNKSVLSGGGDKFRVIVAYPSVWDASTIDELKRSWREAQAYLKCDAEIIFCPRSEAYLAMDVVKMVPNIPTLTIDTSWYMTEFIYRSRDHAQNFVLAGSLGAQELCGLNSIPDNYMRSTPILDAFLQECYERDEQDTKYHIEVVLDIIGRSHASLDSVFAHLLKHNERKFIHTIRSYRKEFYQLAVVHLCAQAYYAANAISRKGCDVPRHIMLSGVGAAIIRGVFCSETVLSEIFQTVFRYVGHVYSYEPLCDAEPKVSIYDRPVEAVAEGAVYVAEEIKYPDINLDAPLLQIDGLMDENRADGLSRAEFNREVQENVLKMVDTFLGMLLPESDDSIDSALCHMLQKTWSTVLQYPMDPAFIEELRKEVPDALTMILRYHSLPGYLQVSSLFSLILSYALPETLANLCKNHPDYF